MGQEAVSPVQTSQQRVERFDVQNVSLNSATDVRITANIDCLLENFCVLEEIIALDWYCAPTHYNVVKIFWAVVCCAQEQKGLHTAVDVCI